jgi:hypothetical protein
MKSQMDCFVDISENLALIFVVLGQEAEGYPCFD